VLGKLHILIHSSRGRGEAVAMECLIRMLTIIEWTRSYPVWQTSPKSTLPKEAPSPPEKRKYVVSTPTKDLLYMTSEADFYHPLGRSTWSNNWRCE
jgi:hypothetical protein